MPHCGTVVPPRNRHSLPALPVGLPYPLNALCRGSMVNVGDTWDLSLRPSAMAISSLGSEISFIIIIIIISFLSLKKGFLDYNKIKTFVPHFPFSKSSHMPLLILCLIHGLCFHCYSMHVYKYVIYYVIYIYICSIHVMLLLCTFSRLAIWHWTSFLLYKFLSASLPVYFFNTESFLWMSLLPNNFEELVGPR